MVLCAYAKMDHPPGPLLTGVSEQLLTDGRVASMAGQELSMLLWACAKLGERPGPLLDLIASELHARMQQDLRASWSVSGSAPDEDRETGGRVTVTALLFGVRRAWVVPPAPAQQYAEASRILSNVSWAYGKLSYHPGGLLHAAAACSTPLLGSMPPKDIARLVWGFARLGYGPSSFLSATARELRPERLSTFRPIQVPPPWPSPSCP